jgi:hypothetical protein
MVLSNSLSGVSVEHGLPPVIGAFSPQDYPTSEPGAPPAAADAHSAQQCAAS